MKELQQRHLVTDHKVEVGVEGKVKEEDNEARSNLTRLSMSSTAEKSSINASQSFKRYKKLSFQ